MGIDWLRRWAGCAALPVIFVLAGCPSPLNEDTTPPASVANLAAAVGDGRVTLAWTDPGDADFSGVTLSWSPGDPDPLEIEAGIQSATVEGLANGTEYSFALVASDTAGNRSSEATILATPTAGSGASGDDSNDPDPPETTPPAGVSDLDAVAGNTEVSLAWADPAAEEFAFVRIHWMPGEGGPTEVDKGIESFTVSGLANGTEYAFSVVTVDQHGNESPEVTATATPLAGPPSAPIFSFPGGDYFAFVEVEVSTPYSADSIYYTLDGTEPTQSSAEYTGSPISIGPGTTTVRARAYTSYSEASEIAEAGYEVEDGILVTTDAATGEGSLDHAIITATDGQEIRFAGDYLINAIDNSAGWEIDNNITINGLGHTIEILPALNDQGNPKWNRRIFTVRDNSSLTLKNVTLRDAKLDNNSGGSVRISSGGSLSADTVSFMSNVAFIRGGAIYMDSGSSATIENSVFAENASADGGGGAIYAEGNNSLTIHNTEFTENLAGNYSVGGGTESGGAIRIVGSASTLAVRDSSFVNNSSHLYGGAIELVNGALAEIVRSEFADNKSGLDDIAEGKLGGGAINVAQGATLRVAGTTFESNLAYRTGENSSQDRVGGAIRNQGTLISYGNIFRYNEAEDTGSAIFSGNKAEELTVSSSSFIGNVITENETSGAAVFTEATTSLIQLSSFSANDQGNTQGGIDVSDTDTTTSELTYSAFQSGTFDPEDFDTLSNVIADGLEVDGQVENADPGFTAVGDLRPAGNSPLRGAGDAGILLRDIADVDGDDNITEREPYDASGTTARVLNTIEIGAREVAE